MSHHTEPRMDHMQPTDDEIAGALASLRVLLLDALRSGKYIQPGDGWQQHGEAHVLDFGDQTGSAFKPGRLVLAKWLSPEIVSASVDSGFHSYVMLGGWADPAVDLGRARSRHLALMQGLDRYWAAYVLQNTMLVAAGAPPSSCRLLGEIINLQMPASFVQRRVCAVCHTLNSYFSPTCIACGRPLAATGAKRE